MGRKTISVTKTLASKCKYFIVPKRRLIFIYCKDFQFSSVAQSCLTLCDPMDYSTPGFPVHHQLTEITQTHVH